MLGTDYEIKAENGTLKRVNVEHGVVDAAPLLRLQAELKKELRGIKLKPENDLHVTLYHFGQPDQIFTELNRRNPELDFETFLRLFLALIIAQEHASPEPLTLPAKHIAKFGSRTEPVIALELVPNKQIIEAHSNVSRAFHVFLAECGITNIDEFLSQTYIGYYAGNPFLPHISLGRLPHDMELPPADVAAVEAQLTRSRLRNVLVREGETLVFSY